MVDVAADNTSVFMFWRIHSTPAGFKNETESWNGTNWTEVKI